ncbi:hypothetical protein [Adhaeretor mobilis]|uniref:PEP-CTERM protein-sorting domain-containing protein n=1 Tax=Adhaeretor mobilis TaxID=1930276 RepID=A0A517MXJ8_9BACT|nr:hypothetical protein [Adhaeretor mobilis]QDS99579.1 hypothetical protein HG15A2_29040 [Adhaeretor mobilis]
MTMNFNLLKERSSRALLASGFAVLLGAFAASSATAQVTFPDLSAGGTFTLNAGETTTNTATAAIADDALAVLNINGTWNSGGFETQLGGINGGNASQDVTLNIGATGEVNWTSAWIAAGWPGNAVDPAIPGVVIDFQEGGVLSFDGAGFGPRSNGGSGWSGNGTAANNGGGANALTLYSYLYDAGVILFEGGNSGNFAQTFTFSGVVNGAHTLTAEPLNFDIGDFNEDTFVNVADFTILSNNLAGELDGPVVYADGDIDFDGDVDLDDFGQFKDLFPAVVAAATGVPEPHTLGLLALACGLLTSVRTRHSRS